MTREDNERMDDNGALIAFLNARLDEDAEIAQHARDLSEAATRGAYALVMAADDVAHVARHNPARVLREVQAKRQLLNDMGAVCGGAYVDDGEPVLAQYVLWVLALPYADHPDYQQKWAL